MVRWLVSVWDKMAADDGDLKGRAKDSTATDLASDIEFPLVFRCLPCGTIIGDSSDWVAASETQRTVTLRRVTAKVVVGRTLIMSTTAEDVGSGYVALKCDNCKKDLGKMYKTTSSELDYLRNHYTFDIDRIDSYQIGSADVAAVSDSTTDELVRVPQLKSLLTEISKIKSSIAKLEKHMLVVKTDTQGKSSIDDKPLEKEEGATAVASINDAISTAESAILGRNKPDRTLLKRKSNVAGLYVASLTSHDKKGKLQ